MRIVATGKAKDKGGYRLLNESAVIAQYNVRTLQSTKFDRKATADLQAQTGVEGGVVKIKKLLMPEDPIIASIKTVANKGRNYHYDHTLPWQWKGGQMLPSAFYMEYTRHMADIIREFDNLADQFCDPAYYQSAVSRSLAILKNFGDAADYPDASSIRNYFFAAVEIDPIPSSGDFRVDLHADELRALESSYRDKEKQLVDDARDHLYKRLLGYAEKAAERLGDPDKVFHKTLPANIQEFTRICKQLNISGDTKLEELADELAPIGDMEADDLRNDEELRKEAAETAEATVDKIRRQMEAFKSDD